MSLSRSPSLDRDLREAHSLRGIAAGMELALSNELWQRFDATARQIENMTGAAVDRQYFANFLADGLNGDFAAARKRLRDQEESLSSTVSAREAAEDTRAHLDGVL